MNQEERRQKITELFEEHNEEPTKEEQLAEFAEQLEKKGWTTQAKALRGENDSEEIDYDELSISELKEAYMDGRGNEDELVEQLSFLGYGDGESVNL